MGIGDVFHEGERCVQERAAERAIALLNGRIIASAIPRAARTFVLKQTWCIVGGTDGIGRIWASVLVGEQGFLVPNEALTELTVRMKDHTDVLASTPPLDRLCAGQALGLLLIELPTRRRLRINGSIVASTEAAFRLHVHESFPACPKYIQRRQLSAGIAPSSWPGESSGAALSTDAGDWIDRADTLFVASIGPNGRMDVSHRGGNPGFVLRRNECLLIPDYAGNSMFNTLGNLTLDTRCGLSVPDFERGLQLQLTGEAQPRFDVADEAERTGGTRRWLEFKIMRWQVQPWNMPVAWSFVDVSPFNP